MELINKYRPTLFKHVLGQQAVCRSIRTALKNGLGRAFILAGPTGVGKTTIARLIAKTVGCPVSEIIEIDGATNTGIGDMREVTKHFAYKSLNDTPRVIIVDECHAISAQAWKSLLKSIEEPPAQVYWVLCTTEFAKVPKEVKTRCMAHNLEPVSEKEIKQLILDVADKEKLPILDSEDGIDAIVELAVGSPRYALSMLATAGHSTDEEEIRALCSETGGDAGKEAGDLCRLLMKGADWKELLTCIGKIKAAPESVRIVVLAYMSSVILKRKDAGATLAIMEAFRDPFNDREGKAPLILACAELCFGGDEDED